MKYEQAIVTYIDILGFSDLVSAKTSQEIHEILMLIEKAATPCDSNKWLYAPETKVFSDSIIRIRKINTKANIDLHIGLLFYELSDLIAVQVDLICGNILIRGGITFGKIYVDDNKIYGPAFIRAHDLESKFANYPRVVVDPALIREFKKNNLLRNENHSLKQESSYIKEMIRLGDDGLYFIDYLRSFITENPDLYLVFLKKHREIISESIKKYKDHNEVIKKYLWMANYHNILIDELMKKYKAKEYLQELHINSCYFPSL